MFSNCTSYLCCRPYSVNKELHTGSKNASLPASRFGSLFCDTPADLGLSTFNTMPQFFEKEDISFAIYTGDIVSHDGADQLSRAYVEYSEAETYRIFKSAMGNVPIFPTLGNHDSLPEAFNTPNSMNPPSGNLFSWNYEMVSSLWAKDGWITPDEAKYASTHYGAYAHTTREGLRVISLNSDFWYTRSIYSYINFTNPDQSGILEFLADELTKCEQKGQRAWVISHVLTGYDGTQSLPNPSGLFHSIVRRFSPTTIAGVFFGHTHEDQIQLYYDFKPSSLRNGTLRNTTNVDYTKPLMVGYIGPSVTPLTGNNAGYQRLQVDRKTFSIMGTQTYFANMTNSLAWSTPIWELEYDTRKEYTYHSSWPKNAPLNATFWHRVTEQMLQNQTLVERYNLLETKSAVGTKNCSTKACAQQKVCYIRSGNAATGLACGGANGPS
jgi:sphingomyelin phosphodiesterase